MRYLTSSGGMVAAPRVWRSRRVVLPNVERPACVVAVGGRIASIEPWDAALKITDELGDLALLPGLVDTHVHVNDPGRANWEGFASATSAAAAGGVTTIVDMPLNSIPATTTEAAVRAKLAAMVGNLHVDVGLWGGVVPGNADDLVGLACMGVLGFKCFLAPSGVGEFEHVDERDLLLALRRLAILGLPLLVHAEDPEQLGVLPASTRRHADWLASRPPEAEASAIRMLARVTLGSGLPVHIVHVSSRDAVDALAHARVLGARMTAETCPHYLTFDVDEIDDGATQYKCAPPLRSRADQPALAGALMRGELDLVASDHSPAPAELKQAGGGDFARAWGGIASLELSLSATWTAMRKHGAGLADVARWMSANPALLAGLSGRKGRIEPGLDADLVAFDPEESWTVEAERLQQRHKLTPYAGWPLQGRVRKTWLRGVPVYAGGKVSAEPTGLWQSLKAPVVDLAPWLT